MEENGSGAAQNAGDGGDIMAELLVKQTIRKFNALYLHYVQVEENRCKGIEEDTDAVAPSNCKGKKTISKDSTTKKRKKLNCEGKQVYSDVKKRPKRHEVKIDVKVGRRRGTKKHEVKVSSVGADAKRGSKRPDLKAASEMLKNTDVLYPEKTFGQLPGIPVGFKFFSRCEMVAVGLHSHWLNGIDYMGLKFKKTPMYKEYSFPLATSIVVSGQYKDDMDNANELVYTGQGGHDLLGSKLQNADQKMERGNLALKNSFVHKTPVRVIRGHESGSSYTGKVYTYDGLYKVVDHWTEKNGEGFTIFRFRLRRLEGQPPLTTDQVHFSRSKGPACLDSNIRGLVCKDISGGQERLPITATNVIDDPPVPPSGFEYQRSLCVSESIKLPSSAPGCNCRGRCYDPRVCACAKLNGSDFPYVQKDGGRLIEAKAVVYECGPNCSCQQDCVNRTSQNGLKYRLEVYKTPSKGWAVRSWDTIPSGAPVCEYTGILMKTKDVGNALDNNYIFDIDCLQTINGLDGREKRSGEIVLKNFSQNDLDSPEFCIDAGAVGNVARFINHSCEPNLFVQCVLDTHHDIRLAKIMLFAADTIPPLQELTYDYGYILDSVVVDGRVKTLDCYCGAATCRKRMY